MIAIWIAIGIVAGSDADDESERWKESRRKEEDEK